MVALQPVKCIRIFDCAFVREPAKSVDLQTAEHRHIEMPAPDQRERHRGIECDRARERRYERATRVRQMQILHAFRRAGAETDDPVLRLEIDLDSRRHELGDRRRQADAEIDEGVVTQLSCNPR